jgi:hypothetical protein
LDHSVQQASAANVEARALAGDAAIGGAFPSKQIKLETPHRTASEARPVVQATENDLKLAFLQASTS